MLLKYTYQDKFIPVGYNLKVIPQVSLEVKPPLLVSMNTLVYLLSLSEDVSNTSAVLVNLLKKLFNTNAR